VKDKLVELYNDVALTPAEYYTPMQFAGYMLHNGADERFQVPEVWRSVPYMQSQIEQIEEAVEVLKAAVVVDSVRKIVNDLPDNIDLYVDLTVDNTVEVVAMEKKSWMFRIEIDNDGKIVYLNSSRAAFARQAANEFIAAYTQHAKSTPPPSESELPIMRFWYDPATGGETHDYR